MYPRSSSPAKPTTMFKPSDRNTNKMARLAMRTHAVPAAASANGSAISAIAISATPTHFACGLANIFTPRIPSRVSYLAPCASSAVSYPLPEQSGGPEHQHRDQHQESEHVLVIAAENIIGQVADIACAQGLDDAEQNAAQHRARKIADAAQHRGRERFHPQKRTHAVVGNAVIGADHHAGDRRQGGADDEREGDDAVDVYAHQARH